MLDLDPHVAASRGAYGAERYEKVDFQTKVRAQFHALGQRMIQDRKPWVVVDASQDADAVADEIRKQVEALMTRFKDQQEGTDISIERYV